MKTQMQPGFNHKVKRIRIRIKHSQRSFGTEAFPRSGVELQGNPLAILLKIIFHGRSFWNILAA